MKPYVICKTFEEINKMFEQEFIRYDAREADDALFHQDESICEPEPLGQDVYDMDTKEV